MHHGAACVGSIDGSGREAAPGVTGSLGPWRGLRQARERAGTERTAICLLSYRAVPCHSRSASSGTVRSVVGRGTGDECLDSFRRRLLAKARSPDTSFFLVVHGLEIPRENGLFLSTTRLEPI